MRADTPAPLAAPPRRATGALHAVFVATGFAALSLQVAWHRVLALHAGVDLGAATTVVAAFLLGLGLGNLLGGRLADRAGPRRSLALLATAEAGVGIAAWWSVPVLAELPPAVLPRGGGSLAGFVLYAGLLVVPTSLMGLSVPLAARVLAEEPGVVGAQVGRLYGWNTLGAAAGALVTGWLLVGWLGLIGATRVAAVIELCAAGAVVLLWSRARRDGGVTETSAVPPAVREVERVAHPARVWPWMVAYGATGAAALGLQQIFLRVVDVAMRSNAYSFSLVLGLYLACFGTGAALGGRLAARTGDPRRAFLRAQLGVALCAALPLVVLGRGVPLPGLDEWFTGEGFRSGFGGLRDVGSILDVARFGVLLPLGVLGPAVLLMGLSFPFVEQVVAADMLRVGRRTGALLAVNLAGNVGGALLSTFVLVDLFGTVAATRLLTGVMVVSTVIALAARARRASPRLIATGVTGLAVIALLPAGEDLWSRLHGVEPAALLYAEDRSCLSAFRLSEDGTATLVINGAPQNTHPFDDFHVLIGLLPALSHPAPERALAVGLGVGATNYGILQRESVQELTTAELCGGNLELIRRTSGQRREFRALVEDRRNRYVARDGRRVLRESAPGFDVVVVDTLLPESAASGNSYSREFYELVRARLSTDGLFSQWVPTGRVLNTAAQVFPYVVTVPVPSYGSQFMLAARSPVQLDGGVLVERFDRWAAGAFPPPQRERLRTLLSQLRTRCVRRGGPPPDEAPDALNTDLQPRDEYFLNNPRLPPPAEPASCSGR